MKEVILDTETTGLDIKDGQEYNIHKHEKYYT